MKLSYTAGKTRLDGNIESVLYIRIVGELSVSFLFQRKVNCFDCQTLTYDIMNAWIKKSIVFVLSMQISCSFEQTN